MTSGVTDFDYRSIVRIPSDDPEGTANALAEHLKRHERDLGMQAYERGEVRERHWWESPDGAELSRPEALGSRAWTIGYTHTTVLLRVDVPAFERTIQVRESLLRWKLLRVSDSDRQDRYGDTLARLIFEATGVSPDAWNAEWVFV